MSDTLPPSTDSEAFYLKACDVFKKLSAGKPTPDIAESVGLPVATVEGIIAGDICPAARRHMIADGWAK